VVYGYAVDASWNPPSPNPPNEIPDDFPINANIPEAYHVVVAPRINTLYYDSESGYGGGVLRLQINVHDWQGQLAGNIKDQVQALKILSPDMYSTGIDASFLNEDSVKARYMADLTGFASPQYAGENLLAVRAVSEGGPNYDQGAGTAPAGGVDTWQVLLLDVPDPE